MDNYSLTAGVLLSAVAYVWKKLWALCQGNPWAPRGLLGGIEWISIQGPVSAEESHPCKVLHALENKDFPHLVWSHWLFLYSHCQLTLGLRLGQFNELLPLSSFVSVTEVFSFSLQWSIKLVLKTQVKGKEQVLLISFQSMTDLSVICCAEECCRQLIW